MFNKNFQLKPLAVPQIDGGEVDYALAVLG